MAVPASAQFAATQDAQYIATLRAVLNYKIDDEENIRNIEKLREDKWFNQKLTRMLDKLQNTRSKMRPQPPGFMIILIKAGRDIYSRTQLSIVYKKSGIYQP